MSMSKNIQNLWTTECLPETKKAIAEALAADGRIPRLKSINSVRQIYFYNGEVPDNEAPIVLEIMHNALRAQNERINLKIRESEQV